MALVSVLSVDVKPERYQDYQERVAELAECARQVGEELRWTAHEAAYGEMGTIHFAANAESFADLGQRGLASDLVLRVMGEQQGRQVLRGLSECVLSQRNTVSTDRPDLSYPPDDMQETLPAVVLSVIRARSGQLEACEELIRKVAEAIPKVGDSARVVAFQTVLGDLSQYWTVRSIRDLAELDQQRSPAELLNEAFGSAEGGLIFRAGIDAIENVERSVLLYREDLSNSS